MKHTVLVLALFVQCSLSFAVAQTFPPELSTSDAASPVAVAIRDVQAASSVGDSVPICGTPGCYRPYISQKIQKILALENEFQQLSTAEEKVDFLAKNYWVETAQLRVASNRMCSVGGDSGCVRYANSLFTALNKASQPELNSPSAKYLYAELNMLTDKSCGFQHEKCLMEHAIEYLDAACERSSGEACLALAEKWAIVEGLGLEKSRTHADIMSRACSLDIASACWSLVKNDLRRTSTWTQETFELAKAVCASGIKEACLLISHSGKYGKLGMTANPNEAKQFLAETYCTMLEFSDVQCDMKFKEL